jgi:hypothetical protein
MPPAGAVGERLVVVLPSCRLIRLVGHPLQPEPREPAMLLSSMSEQKMNNSLGSSCCIPQQVCCCCLHWEGFLLYSWYQGITSQDHDSRPHPRTQPGGHAARPGNTQAQAVTTQLEYFWPKDWTEDRSNDWSNDWSNLGKHQGNSDSGRPIDYIRMHRCFGLRAGLTAESGRPRRRLGGVRVVSAA